MRTGNTLTQSRQSQPSAAGAAPGHQYNLRGWKSDFPHLHCFLSLTQGPQDIKMTEKGKVLVE